LPERQPTTKFESKSGLNEANVTVSCLRRKSAGNLAIRRHQEHPHRMATRVNQVAEADRLARWQLLEIGRELRLARITSGKRQADVGRVIGTSTAQVSRIERGKVASVAFWLLARFAGSVGLKLSVRAYPNRHRLMDAPQIDLLRRFTARAHATWWWETEVPMPLAGDLRAADAVGKITGCAAVVEVYARLADYQAQSRSARLKKRDLGADRLVLLIAGTSANRRAAREAGDALRASFPLGTKAILKAFREGRDPGADGIVLL
jgi:transcriptional regulator with XRE-family HTH domain